jgi:hypothetical protein
MTQLEQTFINQISNIWAQLHKNAEQISILFEITSNLNQMHDLANKANRKEVENIEQKKPSTACQMKEYKKQGYLPTRECSKKYPFITKGSVNCFVQLYPNESWHVTPSKRNRMIHVEKLCEFILANQKTHPILATRVRLFMGPKEEKNG